jgi:hypothetical protein
VDAVNHRELGVAPTNPFMNPPGPSEPLPLVPFRRGGRSALILPLFLHRDRISSSLPRSRTVRIGGWRIGLTSCFRSYRL